MTTMNGLRDLHAGRTVLIAGGTGNVGRVLVEAFLRAGANVVVPSRSREKIAALRDGIHGVAGERLITVEGNLGEEETASNLVEQIISRHGPLHAAIASLGRFVPVPSLLQASVSDLQQVIDAYLIGHFVAARSLIPALEEDGSYTLINGPLAFQPFSRQSALVSIATAAQAMLARLLFDEVDSVRVNQLVLYTGFGWGDDDAKKGVVAQEDVARYACYLASEHGAAVRGQTIHLESLAPLMELVGRA